MWIKIKNFFLNILFPAHCLGCGKEQTLLCTSCIHTITLKQHRLHNYQFLDNVLICTNYHNPLINKAIKAAKYKPYSNALMKSLSLLIIQFLNQSPEIITMMRENNFVLVPIPLSGKKYARRGFNQAEILACELSQHFKWRLNTMLLTKTKHTKSQTKLPYKLRKINVKNTFSVLKAKLPKNVILVDDVFTTGATLKEAAKTLKKAGVKKVWAIVLAKS